MTQVELKYVYVASERSDIDFFWKNVAHKISFDRESVDDKCTSLTVLRLDDGYLDPRLLHWLALFFGEGTREPYPVIDNRFNWMRGTLYVEETDFCNFIKKVENLPFKSHPRWKQELLEMALSLLCNCAQHRYKYDANKLRVIRTFR